ncbi:MAG: DegV family protein [Eubacteriales bacterium]|nr:DegV family protein [Eubacteriales bacterium]
MKWNIVTDSSCDLQPKDMKSRRAGFSSVPFIISVDTQDFVDDENLNTAVMLEAMERCAQASHTSCPSPQSWSEKFEEAEQTIAITISSQLSGSMNSAIIARKMVLEQHPEKKIAVLDSCSTGPEIAMCVERIMEKIESGADFESVVDDANAFLKKTKVIFALSSFDNLVKNGRMSKMAGFIARRLGMWGIGVGSEEGTIVIKGKVRGSAKAIAFILERMKENGFSGGKVMISHCQNPDFARRLKEKLQELWKSCEVQILPTRGLCSYYAERGGVILSY